MDTADPAALMRRALDLARNGWGLVRPNPLVGALVVRDGTIVGEGWHAAYGEAHAEVQALRDAGDAARGATLYVTLEPCAHTGRTPPCTDAIAAAGIAEVVFAAEDPNPLARGGAEVLRQAGLRVQGGVERAAARRLNAAFFHAHESDSPHVTLKLATSIDGRIADRPGRRSTITGPAAQLETQRLRAASDAVIVGIGTALADDPLLTVRDVPVRIPPARVVLDTDARLRPDSRLVATIEQTPLVVVCAPDAEADRVATLEEAGVRVLRAPRGADGIDPAAALRTLKQEGLNALFVEGGGRLATSLLAASLVHRLHLFVAPFLLGVDAVPAFTVRARLDGWTCTGTAQFDDDVLMSFDRAESA